MNGEESPISPTELTAQGTKPLVFSSNTAPGCPPTFTVHRQSSDIDSSIDTLTPAPLENPSQDIMNVNTGFSQSVVSRPAGGDALVKSEFPSIWAYAGDEAFNAAMDTYLVDTTWLRQKSWENDSDTAQTYTYQYTTELKITQGADVTASLNISAMFKDFSVGIDASTKTFSANETTVSQTKTLTVDVPPRKKFIFYQRQYNFRADMFFVLDAWAKEWNAGAASGGNDIAHKACTVQILSGDYLVTEKELSSATVGTLQVSTVARANKEADRTTRKRQDLTQRAKQELAKMGL